MNTEILLVDTHLFIKTNDGFWPGIPYDVATALSPTHIFLVVAQPDEIIKRRLNDKTRRRDASTENDVLEELEIAKNMLSCLAVITGAAIMNIQNTEGKADKAASIASAALGMK